MHSQKFNKNVNWNVKETFFNLHINYMAAFDWIKLLRLKKYFFALCRCLSSPNSSLLFVIVFWGATNRSNLLRIFFKIGFFKNFANFIRKHQCWSLFLIKFQAWRPVTLLKRHYSTDVFLRNLRNFLEHTEYLLWLLMSKPRRSLWFIVWQSDAQVI